MVKQKVGRYLATLTLNTDITLYKQWLKGTDNQVADNLPRDTFYVNPLTHEIFLDRAIPQQLP